MTEQTETDGVVDAPPVASALARATASNPKESNIQIGVGCAGALVLMALVGWGFTSCTQSVGSAVDRSLTKAEAEREMEKIAERRAQAEAGPSDVSVKVAAQTAIKDRSFDPGSVRFRDVVVVEQASGAKVVCGEVNARNRIGGYAGYRPFLSNGLPEFTFTQDERSDFAELWNTVCVP